MTPPRSRRIGRALGAAVFALAAPPQVVWAQRPERSSPVAPAIALDFIVGFERPVPAPMPSVSAERRTKWLKGGIIGAVVGGLTGLGAAGLCREADGSTCGTGLVLAPLGVGAFGFAVGAIVGHMSPADPERSTGAAR